MRCIQCTCVMNAQLHFNAFLLDFAVQEPKFAFHFVTATHFNNVFSLKRPDIGVKLESLQLLLHDTVKHYTHMHTSLNCKHPISPSFERQSYAAALCNSSWYKCMVSLRNRDSVILLLIVIVELLIIECLIYVFESVSIAGRYLDFVFTLYYHLKNG